MLRGERTSSSFGVWGSTLRSVADVGTRFPQEAFGALAILSDLVVLQELRAVRIVIGETGLVP